MGVGVGQMRKSQVLLKNCGLVDTTPIQWGSWLAHKGGLTANHYLTVIPRSKHVGAGLLAKAAPQPTTL
ncbi:hypothetical protein CQ014_25330 [Pseudomonas lurida]|nr:hypothetical protein CLM75_07380 [Pseudomonas lurida]PRA12949.1 hypothetical protein CQ002_24830 [Pseudomonas sp. MYb13]PRA16457.1 hypothetical protein CQ004_25695 [Pseudomonas lurida]PRA28616.1 hypothetical protein CQ005_25050 [Pseudomonas lurida]PRB95607.1 hypothetical protein CQ014_25330 [Pseudomonas lurida]